MAQLKGLFVFCLAGASFIFDVAFALRCLYCSNAAQFDKCNMTIECGTGQECYLENVATPSLNFVYNAGCRSQQACHIMDSMIQFGKRSHELEREKKDLVNCAQCCKSSPVNNVPCNKNLCGLQTTAPTTSSSCLSCPGYHLGSSSCTQHTTCPDTQLCYTSIVVIGTAVRFTYGCEDRHLCLSIIKNEAVRSTTHHHGRQAELKVCTSCCVGYLCNKRDCFDLKKNVTLSSLSGK